jgi:hypothetical protein
VICSSCRYAGNVRELDDYAFGVSDEKTAELHAKCPGGTWCDCQHIIPVPRKVGAPTLNK